MQQDQGHTAFGGAGRAGSGPGSSESAAAEPTYAATVFPAPRDGGPDIDPAGGVVLVVDDNEQNLELLEAYLEDLNCTIRLARDGIEALASVRDQRPDIILLDIMMPRMSGFQACATLKKDPATREIPVIMVTALNEVSDVERAVDCGADDFLIKPVNKLELITRVKSLLKLGRLQRQLQKTLAELREYREGR